MPLPIPQDLKESLFVADPACSWPLRAAPVWAPWSQVHPLAPSTQGETRRGRVKVNLSKCLPEGWRVVAISARTSILVGSPSL